ncbi:unnamed protein product [Ilex paraguariensis]|uniref:Uncharacterized protein n=1 Tax=Ilex paraguariensis TaxID=185542 RepID=A0ABC8RW26_9AQUA
MVDNRQKMLSKAVSLKSEVDPTRQAQIHTPEYKPKPPKAQNLSQHIMHFRPPATPFSLYTTLSRHFSSTSTTTKLPRIHNLSKIPSRHRPQAIQEAQKVLTDYLHATRYLPFTYAEHISKNSLLSLSNVISKVDFSPSTFSKAVQRFLRYHPINEFEFFYESIGINHEEINGLLPVNKFFLLEDLRVFNAACALAGFGFPWNKLGILYKEEASIFNKEPRELNERLCGFKDYGFNSVTIIGICLIFPYVLSEISELSEIDALFDDLKQILIDYDLVSFVEGNVDAWCEVCRKIRVFYDLDCEKGKVGELMGRSKNIFLEYPEEVLVLKVDFFSRLGVRKGEIAQLLLSKPEILDFDLESPVISVLGFLKHFGLRAKELKSITERYPYVLGRNKIANVPHAMKSLDLSEWFFDKMKNGDHVLLSTYHIGTPDEALDKEYTEHLERIQSLRTNIHMISKLNFLHSIGYGENKLTIKVFTHLHGSSCDLKERFDCLLRNGVGFSKLCKMVSWSPKILNQQPEILEQKVKFLCQEMGSSLQYLDVFPAYLCYDLEKRIKPRYRFHMWLTEKGLCEKDYSIASMIATSEKSFIARIYGIHPAAPKKWLESFLNKKHSHICQGTLLL